MEQNYVFQVGQYDSRLLIPQVSKALELRMDLSLHTLEFTRNKLYNI